jgi:WD40 repeat protein
MWVHDESRGSYKKVDVCRADAMRNRCAQTGKTKRVYKGHQGPCTSLDFYQLTTGTSKRDLMVTGSWDKTIKVWDVEVGPSSFPYVS